MAVPVEGALAELHPVSDSTLTVYTLASELGFYSFRDLELARISQGNKRGIGLRGLLSLCGPIT